MQVKWTFSDGAVEITNGQGSKRYKILGAHRDEITEFLGTVERAKSIHDTLAKAYRAFVMGLANYQNAVENLEYLISEMKRSESLWALSVAEIAAFFEPAGIVEHFAGQENRLLQFVDESLPRLEVVK